MVTENIHNQMRDALQERGLEIEQSREALREKERVLSTLMSNIDGMVYRWRGDVTWAMEFVSDGCRRLTGYDSAELMVNGAISYGDIVHPDDRQRVHDEISTALHDKRRFFVEYRIRCRDGALKWVWERGVGIFSEDGRLDAVEGFTEDITERKLANQALLQAERSFRSIFENATEGIFQTSPDGRYLNVNPALARIYGYDSSEELVEQVGSIQHQLYVDATQRAEFMRLMRERGVVSNFVSQIYRKNGDKIWISENARAVLDEAGNVLFFEGTIEDVTESKHYQEQLEHLARHDAVTNLPNRLLLNDRLRQMMLRAQRNRSVVAVAFVDLDNFKLINDTLGHNIGDGLLRTVGERMQGCLRESDTVARLGGDEFVLLLSGEKRGEAMSQVVQRVLSAVSRPWVTEGRELSVTCSIGISVFPRDGRDVQMLLKNADTAMYKAKESGRNNFQFYSPEMNAVITERLEMQHALRQAVEREEFVLHYQPKVDLVSGRITGMEALVRLKGPQGTLLQPSSFIPLAEETGLIVPIGEWVMRQACAFNKSLQDRGMPPLQVGINLSVRQFARPDLVQSVERALRDSGLPAQYLELELTESMMMHGPEQFIATLEQLEALGVVLSIDDFGTGYSSLSYLKRFPVAILKVDQSFVRDLGQDADAAAIVKAVISLGHSLGLKVIAEGVETEEQMAFLFENHCDAMQGFLFSRPLSAEEFTVLLERETNSQDKFSILRQLCSVFNEQAASRLAAGTGSS